MIRIGNAPCSWGVEFADDPRNPSWRKVLSDCAAAGYKGIELGPVGFMPEDPAVLAASLAENDLTLIGGVVFRPFHDAAKWDDVWDGAPRTCKALVAHGAQHLVLIDSISPRRAPTASPRRPPILRPSCRRPRLPTACPPCTPRTSRTRHTRSATRTAHRPARCTPRRTTGTHNRTGLRARHVVYANQSAGSRSGFAPAA